MGELAIDEPPRDDPDHLAAGGERGVRERAHQPDPAAAVDDADPACRQPRPRPRGPARRRPASGRGSRRRRRRAASDPATPQNPSAGRRGAIRRAAARPVRDRVLLGRGPQPERPAARRLGRRLEDRVVAEPAGPARRRRDPAAARAAGQRDRQPAARAVGVGERQGEHAHVARAAALRAAARRAPRAACALLSSSVASSPAYRRVRTPGPPSSASTSRPESSASVGRPLARAPNRALIAAFVSNVSPSSTGSPGDAELVERDELAVLEVRAAPAARAACASSAWRRGAAASRRPSPPDGGEDGGLGLEQLRQAGVGEVEQRRSPPPGRTACPRPCPAARRRRRRRCRRR